MNRIVLVYGGMGALGRQCVSHFKSNHFSVGCVDFIENPEADFNIRLDVNDNFAQQETAVIESAKMALPANKLDAIICTAGGWSGGNCTVDFAKNTDLMIKESVWSSVLSASLASRFLKDDGLLTLTGAASALKPTPKMIGYGLAKAAVHHLTESLAAADSGLPKSATVICLLPTILDTPQNRKWRPNADYSTWTPLDFVTHMLLEWTKGRDRPKNGSLLKLVTQNFHTELIPVDKSVTPQDELIRETKTEAAGAAKAATAEA